MKLTLPAIVATLAAGSLLSACAPNPLYWFVPPQKLYVSVSTTHALYVLDRTWLHSTWAQVWLSDAPDRLAYVASRQEILALEPAAKAVAVISPTTNSVIATIGTSGAGTDLAVSSDGSHAFVADKTDSTVIRINLQTNQVDKTFSFAASNFQPVAIAGHPTRATDTYVVSATGKVSVIRGDVQDATTFSLPGAVQPQRIVAGVNQDFYVTDAGSPQIFHVTNPDNPTAVQIPIVGGSGSPYGAAVGADGTVYVTIPGANKVVKISPNTSTELPFDTGGSTPQAVAVDSLGVYIANEGANQVVAMTFSGANLLTPQVMDTLPGPPIDLLPVS